jgi:hypothetical protein
MKQTLVTPLGLFVLLLSATVSEGKDCQNLDAHMLLRITKDGCTNPAVLCTVAQLQAPGKFLDGATWFFTMVGSAESAGMRPLEPASTLSYAGKVAVTTSKGTIMTTNVGVYDPAIGAFSQLDRVIAGTGDFDQVTGTIFVTARGDDEHGFASDVRGEVCTGR